MSASIAHELNQPLGAIYNNAGAAEILIKADPPKLAEVAEILGDIKREDQRASDIIARIRKFLRKSEFELRETDLNEAIDESMRTVAGEAQDKEVVGRRSELEPGLPKVRADRVQLQQVIVNLALNAMEAMHGHADGRQGADGSEPARGRRVRGGIRDRFRCRHRSRRCAPHIFEAFVTSKSAGMGLGLAISRTIIEAHGGEIRAENAPGGGAVVSLHVAVRFGGNAHDGRSCVVHVVDDDAPWRKSVTRLLSAVGYRVMQYESAEQFLETADVEARAAFCSTCACRGSAGCSSSSGWPR